MTQQRYRVTPGASIGGELLVPGDKSISHRALLMNALAIGEAQITGLLEGEDCLATWRALQALGVRIDHQRSGEFRVVGVGRQGFVAPAGPLDFGNSGTGLRLMAGITAAQNFDTVLTGDASLRQRPMDRIADPLNRMGARVTTAAGCPPVTTQGGGGLTGIVYDMPVASAQIKSAILLAAINASGRTVINSPGPSRDHTERLLQAMGAPLKVSSDSVSLEGPVDLRSVDIEVPGDFSTAAFFIVAACLAAPNGLVIRDVGLNPSRTGLLSILEMMGATVQLHRQRMVGGEPVADVQVKQCQLEGVSIPPELVPLAIDEFPMIFVAAAAAKGVTQVTGAAELRHKESDRIQVMAAGLRQVGVRVDEHPDGATIYGGGLRAGEVDSLGDHRVAMAFAVAGLVAAGPIDIHNTANVATSFPGFDALASEVGFQLDVRDGQ